ncbi:MAG: VTT domain-containing protein [Pseudorhodobacter sp.]|nr:VTT domain-containing protein [Pseudorhodobacter sp.]
MSKRAVLASLLAVAVIAGLVLPALLGTEHPVMSEAWVRSTVAGLGMAGPLALIGLMVLAIVASPIPSGPIAVAAGALCGTLWGGAFVVTGAVLGAFAAFGAARYLGFDAVRRSTNPVLKYIAAPRSQFSLMLIVLASRLIPFISFDAVSYAAGITCLSFGRFAFATFLGVVPISFALAAMGAGMAGSGKDWMWIVVLGGSITLLPIVAKWIWELIRDGRGPLM